MKSCGLFINSAFTLSALGLSSHGFVSFSKDKESMRRRCSSPSRLAASLKPAALPLMDAGKALARSGELLIEATSALDLYGGGLSSVGAQLRNSGDCVAQAAASMRFKTASELVYDELREGATCLTEATDKMKLAVEEAYADENKELAEQVDSAVGPIGVCSTSLEAAGAGIMQRQPVNEIGASLVICGESLEVLSTKIRELEPGLKEASESGQRMAFAAERMIEAGESLTGAKKDKPEGKLWLQG